MWDLKLNMVYLRRYSNSKLRMVFTIFLLYIFSADQLSAFFLPTKAVSNKMCELEYLLLKTAATDD